MRGHGYSGAEAEVECVLGRVCLGRVLLGGRSWVGAVFDRLVSSPWVLNPRRRQ